MLPARLSAFASLPAIPVVTSVTAPVVRSFRKMCSRPGVRPGTRVAVSLWKIMNFPSALRTELNSSPEKAPPIPLSSTISAAASGPSIVGASLTGCI